MFLTPLNSINSLLIITLNFTAIHVYPRLKGTSQLFEKLARGTLRVGGNLSSLLDKSEIIPWAGSAL